MRLFDTGWPDQGKQESVVVAVLTDPYNHLLSTGHYPPMSKITIEHNPSEARLQELGVARWEIWEKEISQFPIDFDETESAYVLEGEIIVTPKGGEPVRIVPGDLVSFHAGLDSQWEVVKPLKKHYSYDFPDGV